MTVPVYVRYVYVKTVLCLSSSCISPPKFHSEVFVMFVKFGTSAGSIRPYHGDRIPYTNYDLLVYVHIYILYAWIYISELCFKWLPTASEFL